MPRRSRLFFDFPLNDLCLQRRGHILIAESDLGGNNELVAIPAILHPFAKHGFRLAPVEALDPGCITIRRIQRTAPAFDVAVQHAVGCCGIVAAAVVHRAVAQDADVQLALMADVCAFHAIPQSLLLGDLRYPAGNSPFQRACGNPTRQRRLQSNGEPLLAAY